MKGENFRKSLESAGFNLLSVLDPSKVDDSSLPVTCKSLLVIGSAGAHLWQKMPSSYLKRENPVDEYSAELIENLMSQLIPGEEWSLLYPAKSAEAPMPNLQRLGRLAGWHNDSPLGNGISQVYGLWFAYRAVVALSKPLAPSVRQIGESPCVSCSGTPCISACPAAALSVGNVPNLESCVQYRTTVESPCAENCLARVSCPVGAEWRYTDDQINYFYGRSLLSLREWVGKTKGSPISD